MDFVDSVILLQYSRKMRSEIATESRVKKTLLNARVNLIFYLLTLVLSFFSRKIFLDCLGADFVGLTGTMQNLLGFLNLAELGIGSAIGYVLYKPIFEGNHEKINEIISVLGYLFRRVGIIILVSGVVLSAFLPLIFPAEETGFSLPLIYMAFYSFLATTLIGYFINYRQNLLGADQRNYVVTGYFQSMTIAKNIVQMMLALYTRSCFLWLIIELTFGIVYSFILNWKISQTYPWLRTEVARGKELLKKHNIIIVKTKQLFIQKISYFVQYQTVPFLTYAFVNLQVVAFYGNYAIITDKIAQFVNTFLESSGASIGNLIAEGNNSKIVNLFWELLSMRYFIGGFFSYAVFTLVNPFITLWLGTEYLLSDIVLYLIIINIFLSYTRGGVMQFLFGYGMFADIWAPIAEIVINLSVAITCGSLWGLPGILLGGITSQLLIVFIWKPIYLFKGGFHKPLLSYWSGIAVLIVCVVLPLFVMKLLIQPLVNFAPDTNCLNWIFYAIINTGAYAIISALFMYSFASGFRRFVKRFI